MVKQLPATLGQLLAVLESEIEVRAQRDADAVLTALGRTFVVEVTRTGSAGPVAASAERATSVAERLSDSAIPLVVTAFMGTSGKDACDRVGVSWFDLSGNARIVAPAIRVIVDGQPNRFRTPGRPSSAFAPKSARVSRWLLTHVGEAFTQRDIAQETDISEGLVSRVVSRLEEERYLKRDPDGRVRVESPRLLLDAWREEYRFDKHTIIKGHLAARSGDALTRQVSELLVQREVEHAATGLAAAWQLTRFAGFRIATFYVGEGATASLEALGFREEPRGANLCLVQPNDSGVYQGAAEHDGVRCVHPVQVVLDLNGQPERAAEAAERVRTTILSW